MRKRTDYHRSYWRANAEKRRQQKRESNARVRARRREAQAAKGPKLHYRCLRCRRPLKGRPSRLVGYGRRCALMLFAAPDAPQLDWIGYSRRALGQKSAALRVVARTPKRPSATAT